MYRRLSSQRSPAPPRLFPPPPEKRDTHLYQISQAVRAPPRPLSAIIKFNKIKHSKSPKHTSHFKNIPARPPPRAPCAACRAPPRPVVAAGPRPRLDARDSPFLFFRISRNETAGRVPRGLLCLPTVLYAAPPALPGTRPPCPLVYRPTLRSPARPPAPPPTARRGSRPAPDTPCPPHPPPARPPDSREALRAASCLPQTAPAGAVRPPLVLAGTPGSSPKLTATGDPAPAGPPPPSLRLLDPPRRPHPPATPTYRPPVPRPPPTPPRGPQPPPPHIRVITLPAFRPAAGRLPTPAPAPRASAQRARRRRPHGRARLPLGRLVIAAPPGDNTLSDIRIDCPVRARAFCIEDHRRIQDVVRRRNAVVIVECILDWGSALI